MAHRVAEHGLQLFRDRGLAQEADAERGHRDAQLAGGQVLVDLVHLLERERGPAHALVPHLLEPWLAGAHEPELGGHEEAVGGHQHEHSHQEQQLCH